MKILSQSLVILLFFIKMKLSKEHHGWCSPNDTFCLFSEGNEVRVASLSEAQLKCSDIKNDSWPVELGDERVNDVFIEFINNHSISNVILNALNRNGTWFWKKNNISIQIVDVMKDNALFHNNSIVYSNYSVVCMTDCRANWTVLNQTQLQKEDINSHHPNIKQTENCLEFCEQDINCSSIDWSYGMQFHGCWIHKYPYNASQLVPNKNVSHYSIERTVKSTEICIGKDFIFLEKSTETESQIKPAKLVEILVPIVFIGSILIIIILVVILYKRRTKKSVNTEDCGACKISENGGNSQSQQNTNKASTKQIHVYDNSEEIKQEPNRYLGPRGDQYTEVDLSDKKILF